MTTLILEVTSGPADAPVPERRKTFTPAGGTIGRAGRPETATHWTLPHGYVSSLHATVAFEGGTFRITDPRSVNGIFLNGAPTRLEPDRAYALNDGDTLLIEPYRIGVTVVADARPALPSFIEEPLDVRGEGNIVEELFPDAGESPRTPVPSVRTLDPPAPWRESLALPSAGHAVSGAGGAQPRDIPPGYNPAESTIRPAPVITPPPAPVAVKSAEPVSRRASAAAVLPEPQLPARAHEPVAKPSGDTASFVPGAPSPSPAGRGGGPAAESIAAVLAGAGLTGVAPHPELAGTLGTILRTVVAGVLDALTARRAAKEEFALGEGTRFVRGRNNPLKFSADVDDALHNLFVKRSPVFLGPAEAFEDAFADLRHHQMAMLAGIQAAFDAMLQQFDPDRLEARFERSDGGALLRKPRPFRYWARYRERFDDMATDADGTFRHLFGAAFARAYAAQIEELKAAARNGP